MIVSLFDLCVDATDIDLRRNGGILGVLAVDVDLTIELCEFSVRGPQKLVHTKTDRRARRIKPVSFVRQYGGAKTSD